MKRPPRYHRAFSLMELLVCIAGIVTLASLSMMGIGRLRERSTGYKCMANLRQIAAATAQFAADNRNELPYYYYLTESGGTGSGASTGTWYYNIAPYLGVPRTEISGAYASTERTYLGTASHRIAAPIVLTCPGHKKTESAQYWDPPMSFPSTRPVSYAPSLGVRGNLTERGKLGPQTHWTGTPYYSVKLTEIPYPNRKIWISDSPNPTALNTTETRWQDSTEYKENWARQAFTRHSEGGNVLFFDGHIEWLSLKSFLNHPGRTLRQRAQLYFETYRDPALDE